jgi:dienelactone hydrolase
VSGRAAQPDGCSHCDETINCLKPQDFECPKGTKHRIYVGGSGPPVLILHELPGLTKADIGFAKRLIEDGYTALVPLLFGEPGDNRFSYNLFHICGKDQFDCGGSGRTPPPVAWIREFCRSIRETWKEGLGIGVIGMCLTGEFPLGLLTVPGVQAAVTCQPTDPFNLLTLLRLGPGSKIGLSEDDLKDAREKSTIPILGIRYTGDLYCPSARFDKLGEMFPKRFYRLDLDGHHHSSLGEDFCEAAFEEVRRYLSQQLKGQSIGGKFPALSRLPAEFKGPKPCGKMGAGCKP